MKMPDGPARQRSCGMVMFSVASVCHFLCRQGSLYPSVQGPQQQVDGWHPIGIISC